jgi:hypothetical protein
MASNQEDSLSEGKLDLVPMIDCIMLLLLFFILTTKFTTEEKTITSLLPTDKGQSASTATKVDPPQTINICIYPAGMQKGGEPSDYQNQLNTMRASGANAVIPKAWMRIGSQDPIEIDGNQLRQKNGEAMNAEVEKVHAYIFKQLEGFEIAGERKTQNPVTINCFSGMSWKYALVSYDAVRMYEAQKSGKHYTGDPKQFDEAREVDFAPPRIRDYSAKELGEELFEIIHMK